MLFARRAVLFIVAAAVWAVILTTRYASRSSAAQPPPLARPGPRAGKSTAPRPNILVLLADDLRAELGHLGRPVSTPNLDRLAQRAVSFPRTYAQTTTCNPSRNSFMTGRRPDTTHVWHFEDVVHDEWTSWPGHFKRNGYRTVSAGKTWHWPETHAAEAWTDNEGSKDFWSRLAAEREHAEGGVEGTVRPETSRRQADYLDRVTAGTFRIARRLRSAHRPVPPQTGACSSLSRIRKTLRSRSSSRVGSRFRTVRFTVSLPCASTVPRRRAAPRTSSRSPLPLPQNPSASRRPRTSRMPPPWTAPQ